MRRQCDVCRVEYDAKLPTSRYCSDRCRQRKRRGAPVVPSGPTRPVVERDPIRPAVQRELDEAGIADTYEGVMILLLAERFDDPAASPADLVVYSRELRRRHELVLRPTQSWRTRPARHPLRRLPDELAARRGQRETP